MVSLPAPEVESPLGADGAVLSVSAWHPYTLPGTLSRMPNKESFSTLYRVWWGVVRDSANRVLDSDQDSEDAAQRVFARLWHSSAWQEIDRPGQFFRKAGRHEALSILRSRLRWKTVAVDSETGWLLSCRTPLPDESLQCAERRALLRRLVGALPRRCQLVCSLVWMLGLSHQEVAERLGVSVGAVEKQIARGRRHIRDAVSLPECLCRRSDRSA